MLIVEGLEFGDYGFVRINMELSLSCSSPSSLLKGGKFHSKCKGKKNPANIVSMNYF